MSANRGVLKHFAQQISSDATCVALSPNRTVPKGWLALRGVLGFDGTAHELLSDLAASGSAVLFVDGLDFFGAEERLTVIDLVREAATAPGMSVIVTARRNFGIAEPSWLPAEALDKLGRAKPVLIEELSDQEVDELRSAAPQLTALLSDSHRAKDLARNLFRLSRLANRPSEAPALHTEAEMAEEWWQSADGAKGSGHRDRTRVLKALAEQALERADYLTVTGLPAPAVDALVASESLRDRGNDRVEFHHDVLREWAVANLLFSDPALIEGLPLDRPALADLNRGLELAARLSIERTPDPQLWHSMYRAVSTGTAHESWSRAVLLALVRSEAAIDVLDKASTVLFADRASALCELIRISMAVESDPADRYYAAAGMDPRKIPAGMSVPIGPSWARLILWLLKSGGEVPTPAIPDVVSLYFNWSIVLGKNNPWARRIAEWFYYWLSQIVTPPETPEAKQSARPFNGELTSEQIGRVAEDLRTGFLLLCNYVPHLASQYLEYVKGHHYRPYRDRALRDLLKFRGSLAQAAPKELTELTTDYLIRGEDEKSKRHGDLFGGPFEDVDFEFVPASPAQGPFYDLLLHAPEHGLPLIRRLVDHAITHHSGGRDFGNNAITVRLTDGREHVFAWLQSYGWPRDLGAGPSVVASALMALEAWSHQRIEKGDSVEKVLADVIGQSTTPAAYLLVAVDLLISHWPKSHAAAVPFAACPELLCLDRQRLTGDSIEMPDIFGLNKIQREPAGLVGVENLRGRPSRRSSLYDLLCQYALGGYEADQAVLKQLLERAVTRLAQPRKESDLGDPEFMVLHALKLIDRDNWKTMTVETKEGPQEVLGYVSPDAERDHLKPLQDEIQERQTDLQTQTVIRSALNNPEASSQELAASAVTWARGVASKPFEDETEKRMRDEAIVSAAMIAARDGDPDLIHDHRDWIRATFRHTLERKSDQTHRWRDGLRFNPNAIAFAGTALLLRNRFDLADVRSLLAAAGSDDPAGAHGFYEVATVLAEIDERLPRAVLRCAFATCIQPRLPWDMPKEEQTAIQEAHRREVSRVIESELRWLEDKGEEPPWPSFEPRHPRSRHRYLASTRQSGQVEEYVAPKQYTDYQAAALWLGKCKSILDVERRPWLREMASSYAAWTEIANGSELGENDDPERVPHEWNYAYWDLLAHCLPGLTIPQIDKFALRLVLKLPGEAFLDATAAFLRSVDDVYFNHGTLGDAEASHVRSTLGGRVMRSRLWEWHATQQRDSVSSHLGPAVATLLFNDGGSFQPPRCYLTPKGIERLGPFLPLLQEMAQKGPFLFMVTTLLNLLEVSPNTSQLGLVTGVGTCWIAAYPDSAEFWVGQAVGRRVCKVIETILALDPDSLTSDQQARQQIDVLLGKLVRLGISEAHRVEEALRKI